MTRCTLLEKMLLNCADANTLDRIIGDAMQEHAAMVRAADGCHNSNVISDDQKRKLSIDEANFARQARDAEKAIVLALRARARLNLDY